MYRWNETNRQRALNQLEKHQLMVALYSIQKRKINLILALRRVQRTKAQSVYKALRDNEQLDVNAMQLLSLYTYINSILANCIVLSQSIKIFADFVPFWSDLKLLNWNFGAWREKRSLRAQVRKSVFKR